MYLIIFMKNAHVATNDLFIVFYPVPVRQKFTDPSGPREKKELNKI